MITRAAALGVMALLRRGRDRHSHAGGWRSGRARSRERRARQWWDDDVRIEWLAELMLEDLAGGAEECRLI
eukprot:8396823-Heterocapsa_arctica.AAC.1